MLALDAFEPSEVLDHSLVAFQNLERFLLIVKHLVIVGGEGFESKLVSLDPVSNLLQFTGTTG